MLDVFGAIKGRLITIKTVEVDNHAFRLHYRATVTLLIALSILVTSRQYIGDPIDCLSQSSSIPSHLMDQYCWISTTFTLPHTENRPVGSEAAHPGLGNSGGGQDRTYHQYYQWVCFVLFLQALAFYAPHYLWKVWEGGRIKALVGGLEQPLSCTDSRQVAVVVEHLRQNAGCNFWYLGKFCFCELLNFVNVIVQIYFTDVFLNGAFVRFGLDVAAFSELNQDNRTDPMIRVFPRVTKCTFYTFGPSGDVQNHDALCVLPLNVINEKIYIFLWFWFLLLAIVSGLAIIYRAAMLTVRPFRCILLKLQCRFSPREFAELVTLRWRVADWFLIYQIGQNMEGRCFDRVVSELAKDGGEDAVA